MAFYKDDSKMKLTHEDVEKQWSLIRMSNSRGVDKAHINTMSKG
jgi:hypothetical protein